MKLKRILMIVGVLLASFAASFGVSHFLGGPAEDASRGTGGTGGGEGDLLAAGLTPDGHVNLRPNEREVQKLIRQLQDLREQNRTRTRHLDEREHRVALTEARLKNQAQELESLRVQLVAPLDRLKTVAKELEASRVRIRAEEVANLRYTAGVYDKMAAEDCAPILVAMIENEQLDDAVKIFRFMSERTAGKVMGEIQRTSKEAAVQLTDGAKRVQQN